MFAIRFQPMSGNRTWLAHCAALLGMIGGLLLPLHAHAQDGANPQSPSMPAAATLPTVRVPYFAGGANPGQGAIFWLGKVDPRANYADVRIAYDDNALVFITHVFDRRVTYDPTANSGSDQTGFDAVSLYVDVQADTAAPLGAGSYRFDAAMNHWEPRERYQRAFTFTAGAWQPMDLPFKSESGFRAELNDDKDDRGWSMRYRVPFSSMGLASAPAQGSVLRMALVIHDRDEASQSPLPDQVWPHGATLDQPASWGRIVLGVPQYQAPATGDVQQVTVRHGEGGAVVTDAAVGGHSTCGESYNPNFFNGWGDANYAGFAQLNIQNQWDVADWPCFSKFYITFPLDALPDASSVVSATLTMYLFGNAGYGPGDAKRSYMQVARVAEDWSEQTVTWNNAPPLLQNYTWSWVEPIEDPNDHSGRPRTWDLAGAVADAHAAGEPLRLVIYSTDGDYHSGKYFWSGDADLRVRPRLDIAWGHAGYDVTATPRKHMIRSGETAEYELNVSALRDGETATIEIGPSTPPGMQATLSQPQVTAPGGTTTVTLTDTDGSSAARVYRIPVTVRSGGDTRTTELVVVVNGSQLFLPAVRR
jgi:hypothetical protein